MTSESENNRLSLTQNDMILLAALELCEGDISKRFTAEELLIKSWQLNKHTFGLRGFEDKYPDSNVLYTKLMGKSGLVRTGYLKKVGEKTYTITEAGLSIASSLKPTKDETKIKIDRQLNDAIIKVINHPIFIKWLETSGAEPNKFRDAMYFWGLAPGIPPNTAKERVNIIEKTLNEAKNRVLDSDGKIAIETRGISNETKKQFSNFDERKGTIFLDILDIERCLEFHNFLKGRFKKDLKYMFRDY